jgi:hypothetical protein
MDKLIDELSYELWKTINSLEKTYAWDIHSYYDSKMDFLNSMLNKCIVMNTKEKNLLNKYNICKK